MQRPGRGLSSHVFVCARLTVAPARARAGEPRGRRAAKLRASLVADQAAQYGGEQEPSHTAMPIWVDELTPEIISNANVPARMAPATDTVGPAASRALRTASGVPVPSATSGRTRAVTRMW
jgi:hypothetical protein